MIQETTRRALLRIGDLVVEIHVREWRPEKPRMTLLCVHGFAGTGQDFAILARGLGKSGIAVVAPDIIGRGQSSFLGQERLYSLRAYIACMEAAAQGLTGPVCHLGSSWGGVILLGYLASRGWASEGLILNDVPLESDASLKEFRAFLGREAMQEFPDREAALAHVTETRGLGFLAQAEREEVAGARIMQIGGKWRMRYDPAVAGPRQSRTEFSLKRTLVALRVPTLMAFGSRSPYATSPMLADISANPAITMVADLDDGHPPSLMKPAQVLTLAGFLAQCG